MFHCIITCLFTEWCNGCLKENYRNAGVLSASNALVFSHLGQIIASMESKVFEELVSDGGREGGRGEGRHGKARGEKERGEGMEGVERGEGVVKEGGSKEKEGEEKKEGREHSGDVRRKKLGMGGGRGTVESMGGEWRREGRGAW